jgi:hypothetical protein
MEFQMPDKASLGSTLGLNDTETQILLRLVTWDRLAREQVRAIATCGHRPVKIGSVNAIVRGLRKKLEKHKIKIDAVNGFGWEVPRKARERVRELLARAT